MPKETKDKPKVNLVYYSLLTEIAGVREHGLKKYPGRESWRDMPREDYYDAAIRHIMKAKAAECDFSSYAENMFDESGLLHLSHAAANIMFLIEGLMPMEGD